MASCDLHHTWISLSNTVITRPIADYNHIVDCSVLCAIGIRNLTISVPFFLLLAFPVDCDHMIDYSVQGEIGTRNLTTRVCSSLLLAFPVDCDSLPAVLHGSQAFGDQEHP